MPGSRVDATLARFGPWRLRGLIAALTFGIVLSFATRADALCAHWPDGTQVNVYLNRKSFVDLGFDGTAVEYIVRAAIDEWSTSGRSNIRFRFAGLKDYAVSQSGQACTNDGEDVVIQMNPGNDPVNPGFAGSTECDVTWDSPAPCCLKIFSGWPWALGFPDGTYPNDMWSTLTHELGHVLCLPHSEQDDNGAECAEPDPVNQENVMWGSARSQVITTRRFLKPLDVCRLQVSQGDRVDYVVGHRYDTDGVEMNGEYGNFSFLGDPQDGLGFAIDFLTYYAAWSDVDNSDYVKLAIDDGGVEWADAGASVGGSNSIQVPAVAAAGSRILVAYLYGQTHDAYGNHAWDGTGKTIWVKRSDNGGDTWSNAIWIGTSYSGPALAYRGSGCFVIAYVTDSTSAPDAIRTKVSCDYGQTGGSTNTEAIRITDRPALAWGSNASWGGITWTTNVRDSGTVTANHVRHGRVNYAGGIADVIATGHALLHLELPGLDGIGLWGSSAQSLRSHPPELD